MINLAIIQARMSSKRLPGKVLKKINGIPILEIVYYRLKKVKKIDKICIATSRRNSDKKIVDFCKKNKIEFFAGNLNNVLSRFKFLVNKYLPRYIIRITADNPFFDKDVLSKQINLIKKYDLDYFELKKKTPLVEGADIKSLKVYKYLFDKAKSKKDLEHVGIFQFERNKNLFRGKKMILAKYYYKKLKVTIDIYEDLKRLKKIFRGKGKSILNFNTRQIIKLFENKN